MSHDFFDSPPGRAQPMHVNSRALTILYGSTLFLSAFLLFQVQLILSKYILPWFGGSAAVWTTCMLVFQILLLGGYVYSHLLTERLSPKMQSNVHLTILAGAFVLVVTLSLLWPSAITPGPGWRPLTSVNPVREVVAILMLATGAPFFVLSTTGPLLQSWFARHGGDMRTYRLYSVSNVGSLLGVLTFPFVLEPLLHTTALGRLWSVLFCVYLVACGSAAWQVRSQTEPLSALDEAVTSGSQAVQPTALVRALWFLLAACGSAMLLATTNLMCQELTSIPLLWVLPLALYLLSFILCFDHPRWYRREVFQPLFVLGVFAQWATSHYDLHLAQAVVMPLLLLVACMICHGELVRLKPAVRQLTSFYLAVAAGGALGGVFVALIAPQIFLLFAEYQLTLAVIALLLLVCLFHDRHSWLNRIGFWLALGIAAGVAIVAMTGGTFVPGLAETLNEVRFYPIWLLVSALVLVGAYIQKGMRDAPTKFCAGQALVVSLTVLVLIVEYQNTQSDPRFYLRKRNFYGALRVYRMQRGGKALLHGQTLHGEQLNPPNDRVPTTYYGPDSAIGILLQQHPKRELWVGGLRVGVVGLGVGTLAAYGRPSDYFRFYEINPDVIELSAGPTPEFTYIRDSRAKVATKLGDARVLLEHEATTGDFQNFDVLVLDAFSGDAVPVHLLTTEAFDTYWKHVNPEHGVIAIHVTSRHINLVPVLNGIAQHYNASMLVRFVPGTFPFQDSLWVVMGRRPEDLQVTGLVATPSPLPSNIAPQVWTDDYSDIVRLVY